MCRSIMRHLSHPKDLVQLGVNYTSVAPPPPTIVLNALRESAQRIRAEVRR